MTDRKGLVDAIGNCDAAREGGSVKAELLRLADDAKTLAEIIVSPIVRGGLLSIAQRARDIAAQPAAQVVDDAMVDRYVEAVNAHLGGLTTKEWEVERFDPAASVRRVARIGLTAALNPPAPQGD